MIKIGHNGTGLFEFNGGLVIADEFELGAGGTFTSAGTTGTLRVNTLTGFGNSPYFNGSLQIGHSGGIASGSYTVGSGQSLSLDTDLTVGYDASATFTQTGGTNTISWGLTVGRSAGSNGTYTLSGTGQLSADYEYIGDFGTGTFIQTGGTNTLSSDLYLGYYASSYGTYSISDGTLDVRDGLIQIGRDGIGLFEFNGGLVIADEFAKGPGGTFTSTAGGTLRVNTLTGFSTTFNGSLQIGHSGGGGSGSYTVGVGQNFSVAEELLVGYDAPGTFTQTGGTSTVGHLSVSSISSYQLSGGALEATGGAEVLGTMDFAGGDASMTMAGVIDFGQATLTGGGSSSFTVSPDSLAIFPSGFDPDSEFGSFTNQGTVHSLGSTLTLTPGEGFIGSGTIQDPVECQGTISAAGGESINLSGGVNVSGGGSVNLGLGTLTVTGGVSEVSGSASLAAHDVYVGDSGSGTLNINSSATNITVSNLLHFGIGSTFTAVSGSAIHMTGSAFENESIDPIALAGLSNLTLIFEGGSKDIDPFEVAGEDMGAVMAGLENNFTVNTLQLGGDDIGQLQLVDIFDNQPSWEGDEALYVENLVIEAGSLLDLNGLNLYYFNGQIDPAAIIDYSSGGSLSQILLSGDANRDGVVSADDYGSVQLHFGDTGDIGILGDANLDGVVSADDYGSVQLNFGATSGMGGVPVPEPATLSLLMLGGVVLLRRRWK